MENFEGSIIPVIWLVLGLFIIVVLLFFLILFLKIHVKKIKTEEKKKHDLIISYQKELLKTTILTQEKERNRIAQDIHDGIVSQLNVIRLSKKEDEKAVNEKLKECIKTVRLISYDLMPPLIEETPVEELLAKLILDLEASTEVQIHSVIHDNSKVEASVKLQLVRIVQEVTTNIIKHANATKIVFLLRVTKSNVALKIEDNGVGFKDSNIAGLGLKNITARTQLLNGIHKFKSIPDIKTSFLLKVNLP
ncbi:histidine kinase [Tenacibaculum sp. Bg11-29]|uniref:sensor histidine kinase n=1 Tax=Tenacibaculum sp. Bg11-29 TaxID=2058306 RepID=UPI000C33D8FA|nr:ATP-binding protein [Tenacibaculum sp. Bg11-29]PKH49392.1 histidine kinase [Tenacibaculum sp. Bg11-29]